MILRNFGRALRLERRRQGYSQEEFAHVAGLDRSYVGAIERGEQNPSLVTIAKLAASLDMALSTLLETANI